MLLKQHLRLVLSLSAFAMLSACTPAQRVAPPKPYDPITSARALAEIRGHNGYYALKNVEPGTAKLVVRNVGAQKEAWFAVTTSVDTCKDLASLGTTFDVERGKVSPKEANKALKKHGHMTEYIARDLTPGQSVIVRGIGSWYSDNTYGTKRIISSGSCGPLYTRFTPVEGRAYLVQFEQPGEGCAQGVYDSTDPDNPVRIASEPVTMCPIEVE